MTDAQNYGGLTPHPLIVGLAIGLGTAKPNRAAAMQAVIAQLADEQAAATLTAAPSPAAQTKNAASAKKFSDPERAEIVMFAGYLGPPADNPKDQTTWRFLYQDSSATSWLLVPQDAIVLHQRAPDNKAAFQLRDVIWVRADAPVRQGDQAESQQARFLTGTFTRAGDLHASLSDAGALSPASGILCAPTPECCGRHSR